MNCGIYRWTHPELGECVRVKSTAGDGSPILSRKVYEMLCCEPRFEALPTKNEYMTRHGRAVEDRVFA